MIVVKVFGINPGPKSHEEQIKRLKAMGPKKAGVERGEWIFGEPIMVDGPVSRFVD